MRDGLLVAGGLGLLALLFLRKEEAITAAEGEEPVKQSIAEVIFQTGESGFGVVSRSVGSVLTLASTGGGDVGAVELAEVEDPFGGYEFASESEYRKATYDPGQFQAVTGAGFEWTKSGRYQYKQYLKTQSRQAKAERAGFTNIEDWLDWKRTGDEAEQAAAKAGIARLTGGQSESVGLGYTAPQTRVYTEEELQQTGYSWIRRQFELQLYKAGLGPEPAEPLPEGMDTSHLANIIDWEKTAKMGESPYG